jgi:hypothetical protein
MLDNLSCDILTSMSGELQICQEESSRADA